MRKIKNSSRDLISYFPTTINQKLIDGYRVKLFAKIKDSLDKKKQSLQKEQIEFKEWLKDLKPFNNSSYSPYIGA
ncbi:MULTISPECIES: hypothetical protein [Aliarcobacter]|jgi:hypothetical protein|uniref:Uncharacterized protein n=2 Tax=Aliarcobacter cryaerophilus TaxID=28198 RepID=A0A1V9VBC8_9BACT|nr:MULTISPECIES: hypothetical protein [Aliarcobacter]NCB13458.1 hypothetical protein [Erysipelotrichia bacterium]KLE07308.1 hypothetical protein AF78_00555 [Aliarcobacter butzleri L353]MCT7473665.1 hypothetical protein [Aliarcobacter cryaerophilus]MCT7482111.1 hypothetical protein [Aliarcobacter cryaerophilus]MCT7486792.1 hypothetical protein [Aliarcobacter cryaerophilus]